MEQKEYNIAAFHNRLGDNLQFTTLPEQIFEQFGAETFLYEGPDVLSFSNNEIRDFVWGTNPYIKGTTTENWNAGDLSDIIYSDVTGSFISNWENLHGLEPKNKLPKIYHPPQKLIRLEYITLIELSGQSLKYDTEKIKNLVLGIIEGTGKCEMKKYDFMGNPVDIMPKQIISPYQKNPILIPRVDRIKVNSIWDLWNLLCNCGSLITLNSGTHSLAAAAANGWNEFEHYSFLPNSDKDWIIESKKFIYPEVVKYFDEDGLPIC